MRLETVLATALALLVGVAPAQAIGSELSWDGPAECAEPDRLLFEIERQLGMPLEQAAALEFQVRVESSPSRVSARLRVLSQDPLESVRERVLVTTNCDKMMDTLAVAITLAIGAGATSLRVAAPPPLLPAHDPSALASSAGDLAGGALPAGKRSDELQPSAFALLVGDVGSLPTPALGAALGLRLAWQRVELRGFATLLFDQRARLAATGGSAVGADLSLALGSVLACADGLGAAPATFSLPLCVGWDLGRLSGVGRGISEPRQRSTLWTGPRFDMGLFWNVPTTDVRVGALVGAAVPLNRDSFIVDEIGAVPRPRNVVARAAVGLEVMLQ